MFAKGHGTCNDFVIIPDAAAEVELSSTTVARLCHRRAGIGGDGLIRVARTAALLRAGVLTERELTADAQSTEWFMDYRNSDGSEAEMCGNGARVCAHWLLRCGEVRVGSPFSLGTRAGARQVTVLDGNECAATVQVEMGSVTSRGASNVGIGEHMWSGVAVDVGNPHLAVVSTELTAEDLGRLILTVPRYDPAVFPDGVNVEILTPLDEGGVHMRVWERGVGETQSCGTGTVAAAFAALAHEGKENGRVTVTVPGGVVDVSIAEGRAILTGPSRIVAEGGLDLEAFQ